MGRACSQNGRDKNAFKILTSTPTGKRLLGRPRDRWEENIRMDLKEIGINTRNWVDPVQDRDYWRTLMNATLNFRLHRQLRCRDVTASSKSYQGRK